MGCNCKNVKKLEKNILDSFSITKYNPLIINTIDKIYVIVLKEISGYIININPIKTVTPII